MMREDVDRQNQAYTFRVEELQQQEPVFASLPVATIDNLFRACLDMFEKEMLVKQGVLEGLAAVCTCVRQVGGHSSHHPTIDSDVLAVHIATWLLEPELDMKLVEDNLDLIRQDMIGF